jgi:hypothetical protein
MKEKCINDKAGLEYRCHGGTLWELTHGEMGPPGNRQNTGRRCPLCNPRGRVNLNEEKETSQKAS